MIEMYETGDGGDYIFSDDGILLDNSLNTIGYISLFGGNIEEDTIQNRKPLGTLYNDFWGNCDVMNNPNDYFNSKTERTLAKEAIKSGNLSDFESVANQDLEFLKNLTFVSDIESFAQILNPDELKLSADILQPSSSEPETFDFFWKETFERSQI